MAEHPSFTLAGLCELAALPKFKRVSHSCFVPPTDSLVAQWPLAELWAMSEPDQPHPWSPVLVWASPTPTLVCDKSPLTSPPYVVLFLLLIALVIRLPHQAKPGLRYGAGPRQLGPPDCVGRPSYHQDRGSRASSAGLGQCWFVGQLLLRPQGSRVQVRRLS